MIKQMLRKVIVTDSGDSKLSNGQTLSLSRVEEVNAELLKEDKTPVQFGPVLLGIAKSAVEADSFLSGASFQETTRVLTDAAVKGKVDHLTGLKENVIMGKLIPAGTGHMEYHRETSERIKERAAELREIRRQKTAELEALTKPALPPEVTANGESPKDDSDMD